MNPNEKVKNPLDMMKFLTVSLICKAINGNNNKSWSILTIVHAPCAEDPLTNELASPTATPNPVIVCTAAVVVVELYWGPVSI